MNMSSRIVESSSAGTTPQPTEKQLRDAIALILRSLQRGSPALIELPDFKQLAACVTNYPSSQVGFFDRPGATISNRLQAAPSCVECAQCGEMFVNIGDHDKVDSLVTPNRSALSFLRSISAKPTSRSPKDSCATSARSISTRLPTCI